MQIERSRDLFRAFSIPIYEKAGFEADDILGTIALEMKKHKDIDVVIATGDMDTLQLVDDKRVQVYTLRKGIKDTVMYDEDKVRERFGFGPDMLADYKGLRGDPSDNIPGIKGIGEKTATELILKFGSIEDMYKALGSMGSPQAKNGDQLFLKEGIKPRIIELLRNGAEEALFSKMLGTIKCDVPVDYKIPDKTWRESLALEPITGLFRELEFRNLGDRVKDAFSLQPSLMLGLVPMEASITLSTDDHIDKRALNETRVALWLLDSNLTNPGLSEILQFAKTNDFTKAREMILGEIEKRGLNKVYKEIELPLIPIIDRMNGRGVKIDTNYLEDLSLRYHTELAKREQKIWELAGEEFNINSPKQLGAVLFDKLHLTAKGLKKTEGGARSTRESELSKMKDTHPIIEEILEHREFQKLLSTYIDNIPLLLDKNGRLHSTFDQAGTTTGRMSSNNPNLQNIPNKTELGRAIRNAFVAEKGYVLLDFDYSQIELRVAAFLSGDKNLIEIFRGGHDVHTAVAARVFKVDEKDVTGEMRRRAKVINFGILYGMGINALRQNLGTDRAAAQDFYNKYFENFSTLAAYLDEVKAYAERTGYTETFFGRRRYFEGIKSKIPYIRSAAERMAMNAPLQGTQSDIMKLAIIGIDAYLDKEGLLINAHLILQVHDEIVYEVREDIADKIVPTIKKIMESVMDIKHTKGVPIIANAYKGKSWGGVE